MEDWLQEPVSHYPAFLMLCEWARGILIVTSFLDNPWQLLPWGWVLVCASAYIPMCMHEECCESDCKCQVSSYSNVWGMQTHHATMATRGKQEEEGGGWQQRCIWAAVHSLAVFYTPSLLPVYGFQGSDKMSQEDISERCPTYLIWGPWGWSKAGDLR